MKKPKRSTEAAMAALGCCVICVLFALLCLSPALSPLLSGSTQEAGEESFAGEPAASEETEAPHEHRFDPVTGVCFDCGEECPHTQGFGSDHCCLVCGWRCDNTSHDPETALCPVCGEAFRHHFGMDCLCDVCGAEAPLVYGELPDRYFEPNPRAGQCSRETFTDAEGKERTVAVWLPWDYSEDTLYNVVILLHGDGGECGDWVDVEEPTYRGEVRLCDVYDRIVEERLCDPFIVVSVDNSLFKYPPLGESFLRDSLLPFIAAHYSTYMGTGTLQEIREAREHTAAGGLSRGSMYTYSCIMPRCLDIVGNFCCFSNGDNSRVYVQLNSADSIDYPVKSYIATCGKADELIVTIAHKNVFRSITSNVLRITDGENARLFEIEAGHNFIMWTASVYDALLLMF